MENCTLLNKRAYNALAPEYQEKWQDFIPQQTGVMYSLKSWLRALERKAKVLDIGCGVGLDAFILSNSGFEVKGIDVSEKMLEFARKNAPGCKFIEGDFLEAELSEKFDAIIMGAFIHLFPRHDASRVLQKAKSLLNDGGLVFVSTTCSNVSKEGLFRKEGYSGSELRSRKFWTEQELREFLESEGFDIIDFFKDFDEVRNKQWMNFIVRKTRA